MGKRFWLSLFAKINENNDKTIVLEAMDTLMKRLGGNVYYNIWKNVVPSNDPDTLREVSLCDQKFSSAVNLFCSSFSFFFSENGFTVGGVKYK